MELELGVRTVVGNLKVTGLSPDTDVVALKHLLYQQGQKDQIPVPSSAKQRLVYKGAVLSNGTLRDAGLVSGDQLVMLFSSQALPQLPIDTTPVPDASAIQAAITAEAKRRGLEPPVRDDAASRRLARRFGGLPLEAPGMDVDHQLLQLLQVLEGRILDLNARGAGQGGQPGAATGGAANAGAGGGGGAAAGPGAAGAGGVPTHPLSGAMAALANSLGVQGPLGGAAAGAEPPAPAPAPVIPEPSPTGVAQLTEMGFGDAVVRKALLLHRNEVEAALNWLLQHGDDPAAAEPLTDDQLRQIYSRGTRGPPSEPEMVEQLVEMGFSREQSAAALRRFRNPDLALAYLLRQAERVVEPAPAAAGAAAPLAAAAAAAPAASSGNAAAPATAPDAGMAAAALAAAGSAAAIGAALGQPTVDGAVPAAATGAEGAAAEPDHRSDDGNSLPGLHHHDGEDEDEDEQEDAFLADEEIADEVDDDEVYTEDEHEEGEVEDEEHGGDEGEMDEDEDYDEDEEEEDDEDGEHDVDEDGVLAPPRPNLGSIPISFSVAFPGGAGGGAAPLQPPALFSAAPSASLPSAQQLPFARGPDGIDIVLSAGSALPLMPSSGAMLQREAASAGVGIGGGAGGGSAGLRAIAMRTDDEERDIMMQMHESAGMLEQLLSMVLNPAAAGGGGLGAGRQGPAPDAGSGGTQ